MQRSIEELIDRLEFQLEQLLDDSWVEFCNNGDDTPKYAEMIRQIDEIDAKLLELRNKIK